MFINFCFPLKFCLYCLLFRYSALVVFSSNNCSNSFHKICTNTAYFPSFVTPSLFRVVCKLGFDSSIEWLNNCSKCCLFRLLFQSTYLRCTIQYITQINGYAILLFCLVYIERLFESDGTSRRVLKSMFFTVFLVIIQDTFMVRIAVITNIGLLNIVYQMICSGF